MGERSNKWSITVHREPLKVALYPESKRWTFLSQLYDNILIFLDGHITWIVPYISVSGRADDYVGDGLVRGPRIQLT